MAFKRAGWHSGLTYEVTCEVCKTTVLYMDDKLDFRPWYADGFIYCPKCNSPIRHRESYAIDGNSNNTVNVNPASVSVSGDASSTNCDAPSTNCDAKFCNQCGKAFGENDRFCSGCGAPRK